MFKRFKQWLSQLTPYKRWRRKYDAGWHYGYSGASLFQHGLHPEVVPPTPTGKAFIEGYFDGRAAAAIEEDDR